uniref:Reverse transcriptase domain-containing protein n=1 Tax=Seriola dumerili TaxID=41447 RepID=A0A3B4VI77_SERDU
MLNFLDNLATPSINPDRRKDLDKPITLNEVISSISAMQSGKAPGPDSYPVEFYKRFSSKLAPLLLEMFNHSLDQGSLPQTLTEANITLLLKPGKNAVDRGSYRPISLLNGDVKILAKLLAIRLDNVMMDIILPDQTGFIRGRHSFSNIRRLLSVVHSPASLEIPEVVVSLDAEKAFDRVEWPYLFAVLGKFGFGPKLISWIRLLYASPKASVITNKLRSKSFSLSRGTQQSCPLSPLLFALVIEPLSIMPNTSQRFKGIYRKQLEHRVSLYADDLLLYISDPVSSAPDIVNMLLRFGRFS